MRQKSFLPTQILDFFSLINGWEIKKPETLCRFPALQIIFQSLLFQFILNALSHFQVML